MHLDFSTIIELLPYLSIPFVSALVGWITNVVALRMTFYPINYFGIPPFGWQGLIPSKARKMAETAVDLWTTKLLDIGTQFSKIKPEKVAEEMGPAIDHLSEQIIDEVMEAKLAKIWEKAPDNIKRSVYDKVSENLPFIVEEMMREAFNLPEIAIDTWYKERHKPIAIGNSPPVRLLI